jgi:quercetin dioxygenase-like cupin family protein
MIPRRDVIEGLFKTGMAVLGSSVLGSTKGQSTQTNAIFEHELPSIPLDHWNVTVTEVNYPAGGYSRPHRHLGFVIGYVLEGEVRFQLQGSPEKTYRTGQVFYEPPGSFHQVSANASNEHPARFLALVFAKPEAAKDTAA